MKNPIVIKIGGELATPEHLGEIWEGIARLAERGPVLLVHGGGGQATRLASRLGHKPRIVQGRRVTSDLDLDIVLWTMRGEVNSRIVAAGRSAGLDAVGISGVDGGVLQVDRRPPWIIDGESVDFGWVGDVRTINPALLETLLRAGHVPVVAPVGVDAAGSLFNVNADTVAAAIAVGVGASGLFLVTGAGALRTGSDGSGAVVPVCSESLYQSGLDEGWIGGGMRVKLHVAFSALRDGVEDVRIVGPSDLGREGGTRVAVEACS